MTGNARRRPRIILGSCGGLVGLPHRDLGCRRSVKTGGKTHNQRKRNKCSRQSCRNPHRCPQFRVKLRKVSESLSDCCSKQDKQEWRPWLIWWDYLQVLQHGKSSISCPCLTLSGPPSCCPEFLNAPLHYRESTTLR